MKDAIFREYDIRGVVNGELSVDKVYDLARAIAVYLTKKNPAFKIKNGRIWGASP